ncbi:MAG: chaperonin GroEL, partial [Chthonomonadaceae bacterium]|nr:chaperonin GroEL [Chthonomonadaceae bacterium]
EEGVVSGGGQALLLAGKVLDTLQGEGDEQIGINIVRRAVESPLRTIAENCGVEGSVVVEKVQREGKGFNAATLQYEDLLKAGVVDPTKVVRTCLQNAASISGLLLTTECAIADAPEKEDEGHGHHH